MAKIEKLSQYESGYNFMKSYVSATVLFALFILSCGPSRVVVNPPLIPVDPLDSLHYCMSGFYNSADQAEKDSQYYSIELAMVPFHENDPVYRWLYVEQAISSSPEKPYRIRVYRLEKVSDDRFISRVFSLKDEQRYLQAWKDPALLESLDTAAIEEREGCAVFLERKEPLVYEGATMSGTCYSKLRGAKYANAEVRITLDELQSWDKGYDQFGKQVWGARKGPYIFKKYRGAQAFSE